MNTLLLDVSTYYNHVQVQHGEDAGQAADGARGARAHVGGPGLLAGWCILPSKVNPCQKSHKHSSWLTLSLSATKSEILPKHLPASKCCAIVHPQVLPFLGLSDPGWQG